MQPRIFESMHDRPLSIRGSATGIQYYFSHKGHQIEVHALDSFGLLAEPNLKHVKQ